ncbi:hypothetical protein SEA_MEDIUMFRY_64 [Arthrobacter phage MediumFry]|nr:hypothetical protein SEA_MEDIUMFRY_64 [Arthrobacter phage MediumFry]
MKKLWFILCVLFGMTVIAGCGFQPVSGIVVEKEHDTSGYEWNSKKKEWVYTPECFELDIVDKYKTEHELCVSERVWNDAMLDHHINITEEYH